MNLSKMTKEQKQYIVLGVMVSAALVILVVFGIRVSLSSISKARMELNELTGKIEAAEKSVERSERANPEFLASIEQLQDCLDQIPPERNYYSWATELLYRESRVIGFEIDAVDEIIVPSPAGEAAEKSGVEMESYALRITAHGGYENIKQFLNRFALNHPLVRITGIEISSGPQPEVHDVQLFIEWPFNLDYLSESWDCAQAFQKQTGTNQAVSAGKKMPTPPPPRTGSGGDAANRIMKPAAPEISQVKHCAGEAAEGGIGVSAGSAPRCPLHSKELVG